MKDISSLYAYVCPDCDAQHTAEQWDAHLIEIYKFKEDEIISVSMHDDDGAWHLCPSCNSDNEACDIEQVLINGKNTDYKVLLDN